MTERRLADPAARAAEARVAAMIGRTLSDRYRIDEPIAMGGMGAVFRGEHVPMRKRVAIKVLHPETEGLPELVLRFEREAIAGAHVRHPNVAAATDFGRLDDGTYFLVLEYVRGSTLHELMKQGPVPAARAVRIARQLAAALHAAHQMGVIHRDVKPRNVMLVLGEGDRVKLIDFGFAKVPLDRLSTTGEATDGAPAQLLTAMGVVFGTIAYMAPEAAGGMDGVDARSDLYALGVILYEMLAGRHPFDATDAVELFQAQRTAVPPPIRERGGGVEVPEALEAVVMRLLEKDPAARYQDGLEVIAALDAVFPPSPLDLTAPLSVAPAASVAAGAGGPPQPAPPARAGAAELWAPGDAGPDAVRRPPARSVAPGRVPLWSLLLAGALALALGLTLLLVLLVRGEREPAAGDRDPPAREEALVVTASPTPAPPRETRPIATAVAHAAEPQRAKLLAAAASREWRKGAAALVALTTTDAERLRETEVVPAAVAVVVNIELEGGARADEVFEALSTRGGQAGLDVLFEVVRRRGAAQAARRARDLLRRADVRERASAALRIAFDLREAPCERKAELFERAANEGDHRALGELSTLKAAECRRRGRDPCCFANDRELDAAIRALRARL